MTKLALLAAHTMAAGIGFGIPLTAAAIAQGAIDLGATMAELPPDRLCVDKDSPFYDDCYTRVGVRLNGIERQGDVQEYCVSEGWIATRVREGNRFKVDRAGRYMLVRLTGTVVAYFKDGRPTRTAAAAYREPQRDHAAALEAAEAKRRRRAEKRARGAGTGE